jgi:hypothetical protein
VLAVTSNASSNMLPGMRTREGTTFHPSRPLAAPLDRCAELLGVDPATARKVTADGEPYVRADGTKVWSLLQLGRQLHPEAFVRRWAGGYLTRRRAHAAGTRQDAEPLRAAGPKREPSRMA